MNDGNPAGTSRKSYASVIAIAAVAALAGFAAVYGTLGQPDNSSVTAVGQPVKEGPAATARRQAAGMPAFVFKTVPEALADVSFVDGSGAPKTLEDFRGKTILLNLWATWCAPCREEMPSLDRLQAELGSDTFEVVALAVDRTGVEAAGKFLDSIKVTNLKLYADPTTRSGSALRAVGMPTTILIDPEGREIGRLAGPAEWDSEAAKQLIRTALGQDADAHRSSK
jgi:thiol-disulfide isomerase/thioredoxin